MRQLVIVVSLALTFGTSHVAAQERFDIGVFANATGTVGYNYPVAFVPFTLYVVGFGLGDVFGFEASIVGLPPIMTILGVEFASPTAINIGNQTNWIVGTGVCLPSNDTEPFVLGSLNCILLGVPAVNTAVCVRGSTPSSFDGVPGYLRCDSSLQALSLAPSWDPPCGPYGCLVMIPVGPPCSITTESSSISLVKARYSSVHSPER